MIKPHYDPPKSYQIPENIYYAYHSKDGEPLFHSLLIDGQKIPVFRFALYTSNLKTEYKKMHLSEYAKGFIEGMKYDFIPTIDTSENRRELILSEVENGSMFGFPKRSRDTKKLQWYFDKQDVYDYGYRVGKVYKAWAIIFETPKYFEDGFTIKKVVRGFEVPQIALAIGVTRLLRTGHSHVMKPTETYEHFSKYGGTPGSITKAMTEKNFRTLREGNTNITTIMRDKAREIIVLEGKCKVCLEYLDSYKITSE